MNLDHQNVFFTHSVQSWYHGSSDELFLLLLLLLHLHRSNIWAQRQNLWSVWGGGTVNQQVELIKIIITKQIFSNFNCLFFLAQMCGFCAEKEDIYEEKIRTSKKFAKN